MSKKTLLQVRSKKSLAALAALASFLIGFCLQAQPSYAGAWLQKLGEVQLITSYNYISVDKFFDQNGYLYSANKFSKGEISPYAEWGFSDALTLGGSLNLQSVLSGAGSGSVSDINSYRVAYGEIFMRKYLLERPEYVVSIEPRLKLPIEQDAGINPEGGKPIPELKLSFGRNFELLQKSGYVDLSGIYRLRSDADLQDMAKFEATLGADLNKDWRGFAQAFYELPLDDVDGSSGNYELLKLQLSAAYALNERASIQAGVYSNIYGKNTAAGEGVMISSWFKF